LARGEGARLPPTPDCRTLTVSAAACLLRRRLETPFANFRLIPRHQREDHAMTDFFPTSTTSSSTVVGMAAGDFVYVAPNVTLIDTDPSGNTETIEDASYGSAIIDGAVAGLDPIFFLGEFGQTTEIQIGGAGSVVSSGADHAAVEVAQGSYDISNSGEIVADQDATGILNVVAGVVRNYGTIDSTGNGVVNIDTTTTDSAYLYNYGTIAAAFDGVADLGDHAGFVYNYGAILGGAGGAAVLGTGAESLVNSGTITGTVQLLGADSTLVNSGSIDGAVELIGAGSSLNSTHGTISGTITCGAGGDVVIAGQDGGSVIGGSNDKLYANPTLAAADAGAQTILDGGAGDNWLYGDGAYTTFDSGAAVSASGPSGVNHIFGRLSKMPDVAGYSNNTLSYATLASGFHSVKVDLLTGQAWIGKLSNAPTEPASDLIFEDYIRNVPNVIGSSGQDEILCDNGVDRITSGSGAGDVFFAGVGAASHDTFVYTAVSESTNTHESIIHGFKVGVDKIDFSALDVPAADIVIKYAGAGSNLSTVFVEQDPAHGFNAATDLMLAVRASTNTAVTASSILT
jgi:hypothetical protein